MFVRHSCQAQKKNSILLTTNGWLSLWMVWGVRGAVCSPDINDRSYLCTFPTHQTGTTDFRDMLPPCISVAIIHRARGGSTG